MADTHKLPIADPPHDMGRGAFVPVKKSAEDVAAKRPERVYVPLKDYLNSIADHAIKIGNSDYNKDRRRKVAKMRRMYEGDQIIKWDEETQTYINKKKAGDALYIDPVLATFIDIITAQVAKSRSTLIVRARSEEKVEKQQAAKYATELVKDASKSLLNARNTQREIKYGFLLSGEAYRYTYFDKNVEGRGIEKPKFSVKVAKVPKAWYCRNCDASGLGDVKALVNPDTLPDAPVVPTGDGDEVLDNVPVKQDRCPNCDFPQLEHIGGKQVTSTIQEDSEYENIGDVNTEFPDSLEITVVGARDHIADALVVVRDRMIPRCILEAIYDKDLPSTGTPDNLRYQQAADKDAFSGEDAFEMLHFQEVWVNSAVYKGYISPREETLPDGTTIKKGDEIFPLIPGGGYFARVGKVIVDLYEQQIKDCWAHAVNSITGDFHGQGEWDLMPQQEQKNELRSMQINGIMLDSFRPLMARNGMVDTGKIPNKAGAIIKINDLGVDKPLSHALDRVPGGGTIPDAYVLDDKLAGGMQQRSGAFSSTTDLPDAKLLGTATGVATLAEHAIGRRAPMLALRAEMEKDQGYQFLEYRQAYWPDAMYESLDKKIGGDAGRWFREANIRRDFIIEVVEDSFMPSTAAQDTTNFQTLMQVIVPLSGGDPTVLKAMRQRAIELWGNGIDIDNYQLEKVEAAVRLERLKQIACFFEQSMPVLDPNGQPIAEKVAGVLAETTKALRMPHVSNTADSTMNPTTEQPDLFQFVPVDVLLDNHMEFEDIYTEWMKSSEGRESSLFVRTCVRTLIQQHHDAAVQRIISDKTDQHLTEVPDLKAQQVVDNASAPPPQPMNKILESIAFKDLPPEGKAQMAAQVGLQLNPTPEPSTSDKLQALSKAADLHNADQQRAFEMTKLGVIHGHQVSLADKESAAEDAGEPSEAGGQ